MAHTLVKCVCKYFFLKNKVPQKKKKKKLSASSTAVPVTIVADLQWSSYRGTGPGMHFTQARIQELVKGGGHFS